MYRQTDRQVDIDWQVHKQIDRLPTVLICLCVGTYDLRYLPYHKWLLFFWEIRKEELNREKNSLGEKKRKYLCNQCPPMQTTSRTHSDKETEKFPMHAKLCNCFHMLFSSYKFVLGHKYLWRKPTLHFFMQRLYSQCSNLVSPCSVKKYKQRKFLDTKATT